MVYLCTRIKFEVLKLKHYKDASHDYVIFIVCVKLEVSQMKDDGHQLPDAVNGRVRKVESSERVHHNSEFWRLKKINYLFQKLSFPWMTIKFESENIQIWRKVLKVQKDRKDRNRYEERYKRYRKTEKTAYKTYRQITTDKQKDKQKDR